MLVLLDLPGLFKSDVLSQLPSPTIAGVMPLTVPVNVGDAKLAFKLKAVCVAVETSLFRSDVLLQLPSPTIADVIPFRVTVKVGLFNGAFSPIWVDTVVAKFGSLPNAVASSLNVSKVAGAELTNAAIFELVSVFV